MWSFSLRTNQFEAEYILTALFSVCSGMVHQSSQFIWDFFAGDSVVRVAKTVFVRDLLAFFLSRRTGCRIMQIDLTVIYPVVIWHGETRPLLSHHDHCKDKVIQTFPAGTNCKLLCWYVPHQLL